MPDPRSTTPAPDEIYVGYLPVPPRQKRFLRWIVPLTMWLLCGVSFLWARSQHNPGPAIWNDGQVKAFTGTVFSRPYPMLLADDAVDGKPGILLLVEVGKRGGGQRAIPLDSQRATISGWLLTRDGRRMIEMEPGDAALKPAAGTPIASMGTMTFGRVTLRGEIVDSKCFLGAMKPGEGKTHRECAALCIKGGIPPMLLTRDRAGAPTYYLLSSPSGGPVEEGILPLVGEGVEVTGDLETQRMGGADGSGGGDGLNILRVRPSDIRRW